MKSDQRTVLLGMNNPLSDDPKYALFPLPTGCTGHRLYEMFSDSAERRSTSVSRLDYIRGFCRRNVLAGREWSKAAAREAAPALARELADRRVVVVGVSVLEALRLPRPAGWCVWLESEPRSSGLLETEDRSFTYCLIPHASGRCREYNDLELCRRVGDLLLAEYDRV